MRMLVLLVEDFEKLMDTDVVLYSRILRNLLHLNADRLRRCNQEIQALKE